MIDRLRTLLKPDAAGEPPAARARSALVMWSVGALWSLVCLAVARIDPERLLPEALALGLVLIWGWRRLLRPDWFALLLGVAALIELGITFAHGPGESSMRYRDLVGLALAILVLARLATHTLRRIPLRYRDARAGALVAVAVLLAWVVTSGLGPASGVRSVRRTVLVLAACAIGFAGNRRCFARTAWAFALVAGSLAAATLATLAGGGVEALGALAQAADSAWGGKDALVCSLLLLAPVTLGQALDHGERPARAALAFCGGFAALAAIVILSSPAGPAPAAPGFASPQTRLALAFLVAGVPAGWMARGPSRSGIRHGGRAGLLIGFALLAATSLAGGSIAPTPIVMLAALAVGAEVAALPPRARPIVVLPGPGLAGGEAA